MGDVEKVHPWLFNLGVGALLGIIGWYFFRSVWILLAVPLIWTYVRVALVRSRGTT
jgi:hypothetical protein